MKVGKGQRVRLVRLELEARDLACMWGKPGPLTLRSGHLIRLRSFSATSPPALLGERSSGAF